MKWTAVKPSVMTESGCHIFLRDSNKLSQDMCASSVLRHTIVKCWDIGELFVLWGVCTESVIDFSPIKFMNPKEKSRRSTFKARIGQILKRICGWWWEMTQKSQLNSIWSLFQSQIFLSKNFFYPHGNNPFLKLLFWERLHLAFSRCLYVSDFDVDLTLAVMMVQR